MNVIDVEGVGRVANIEHALLIMEGLAGHPAGVTIAELSLALGLSKSALSRILATLQRQGYVIKNPETTRFRLSHKFISLVLRHLDTMGIDELCGPILRELADATGELVQLALVDNGQMRYVARADGGSRVRVVSILGKDISLHAFAAGKVWLAAMDQDAALKLALQGGLHKLTDKTISSAKELQRELNTVRQQGYALNLEEVDEGVNSIAVPIMDGRLRTVGGALTLTGPAYRLPKAKLEKAVNLLKKAARDLSEVLPKFDR
jgi:IclR family transcriptional regulator, KDG regulon repressor